MRKPTVSRYVYYTDPHESDRDRMIAATGIHIWPRSLSVSLDGKPYDTEWLQLDNYILTADLLNLIQRRKSVPASPLSFLKALRTKIDAIGLKNVGSAPHICMYPNSGPGMAGTGYGSLIAIYTFQPSLTSIECGDGWGRTCLVAVSKMES